MGDETHIIENLANAFHFDLKSSVSPTTQPLLPKESHTHHRTYTPTRKDTSCRIPKNIAHRGYKAKFPENTLNAFIHAVDVGADGLEADIHISRDGVVVISHDASLKRCFGINKRIVDCDWSYLQSLRTLKSPHEPMPRLADLLSYLAEPDQAHISLMLDIKLSNDPETVMRSLSHTIHSIPPPASTPWDKRISLGVWAAKYLPPQQTHLPTFRPTIITYSLLYARQFLHIPHISLSVNQKVLMNPLCGRRFLRHVQARGIPLFVWTVNEENLMRWAVRRCEVVQGVVTDDPVLFERVCRGIQDGEDGDVEGGGYGLNRSLPLHHHSENYIDKLTHSQCVMVVLAALVSALCGAVLLVLQYEDLRALKRGVRYVDRRSYDEEEKGGEGKEEVKMLMLYEDQDGV